MMQSAGYDFESLTQPGTKIFERSPLLSHSSLGKALLQEEARVGVPERAVLLTFMMVVVGCQSSGIPSPVGSPGFTIRFFSKVNFKKLNTLKMELYNRKAF